MRTKRVCSNRSLRERRTVFLTRLRVKSSGERRLRLVETGLTRWTPERQMAGDGGERKRLPKRALPGGREESSTDRLNESVRVQEGVAACADRGVGKKRRGKENDGAVNPLPLQSVGATLAGKMEDGEQTERCGFFDEDSNHVFPVEQFFGNLDAVQDYSQKATCIKDMSRREYRRRHYYAKEDSGEEEET